MVDEDVEVIVVKKLRRKGAHRVSYCDFHEKVCLVILLVFNFS